jgi:hypothetical protein
VLTGMELSAVVAEMDSRMDEVVSPLQRLELHRYLILLLRYIISSFRSRYILCHQEVDVVDRYSLDGVFETGFFPS